MINLMNVERVFDKKKLLLLIININVLYLYFSGSR